MAKAFDIHHILWPKSKWKSGALKKLRSHWYFRMKIPCGTLHTEIHREIMEMPRPTGRNAKDALFQVQMLERYGALKKTDPLEQRLKLLIVLFDYSEPATANALKHQLNVVRNFYNSPQ